MIRSKALLKSRQTRLDICVWMLRILVGAVFVTSGLSKAIDLWGFVYKINEYLNAWGLDVPQSLCLMGAILLSVAEFMLGAMLMLGCYRKSAPWLLTAIMAGMLPLSIYIAIYNPVADCGCFGDIWHVSNTATLIKNILIVAALIPLLKYNNKVEALYNPYIQWIVGVTCFVYLVCIAIFGYHVQPLIDFRSFPVGTDLSTDAAEEEPVQEFEFIYKKGDELRTFSIDELPDTSWTFVDRQATSPIKSFDKTEPYVVDSDGSDVTAEVFNYTNPQILIVVPDWQRANIAFTYTINELQKIVESNGGRLIEIAAIPTSEIEEWSDLSMAHYPVYKAEPTFLKELSRGNMSAVYMNEGRIVWKHALQSIDITKAQSNTTNGNPLDVYTFDGGNIMLSLTIALFSVLSVILMVNHTTIINKWLKRFRTFKKKRKFAND